MALAALHLRDSGRLHGGGVVVTVMTNYGFHTAMERGGRWTSRPPRVGDRYVLEELRARGWTLGGEQSGHIIDMGFNRTGDGIAGALLTLEALAGGDLAERHAMQQAAPAARQRARARPRGARAGQRRSTRPCRPPTAELCRARARARTAERHRAAGAGDGRGAHRARRPTASATAAGARSSSAELALDTSPLVSSSRCAESSATSGSALPASCCWPGSASSSTAAMTPPASPSSPENGSTPYAPSAT